MRLKRAGQFFCSSLSSSPQPEPHPSLPQGLHTPRIHPEGRELVAEECGPVGNLFRALTHSLFRQFHFFPFFSRPDPSQLFPIVHGRRMVCFCLFKSPHYLAPWDSYMPVGGWRRRR